MVFDDFAAGTYLHIVFKDATIPHIVQKLRKSFKDIQTNKD